MTTIRVHFDGRVLVPDEPVDLPINQPLRISVHEPQSASRLGTLSELAD